MTTRSTVMMKAQGGTNGGRSQYGVGDPTISGGARRVGDSRRAEETQRPGNTVGPEGQGGAVVMSSQARVPED